MTSDPPRPGRAARRGFRIVAVPAALVIVLGLLYLATRPLGGQPRPSIFVIGSTAPGVQIGQIAPGSAEAGSSPSLTLVDLEGGDLSLSRYAGHPIWLIFWKTACQPCEAEAPDVAAALAAHHADGLITLGVDVWDTEAVIRDYAATHLPPYSIGIDPTSSFMSAYGVWGAPTHYFIDADGIIRDRYFGPMTRDQIEQSLSQILR